VRRFIQCLSEPWENHCCFYIESPAMRDFVKCDNYKTLVAPSIIRPVCIWQSGMEAIFRHNHPDQSELHDVFMNNHETYGVMVLSGRRDQDRLHYVRGFAADGIFCVGP
jgi:hypothetical protein